MAGFFTTDNQLANEFNNPGSQARQPLARLNQGADALSSTDRLSSSPFDLGSLPETLQQILATEEGNPYSSTFGMLSGGMTGQAFNPSVTPNTALANNQSLNTGTSSGGNAFTNLGMGGASNSNNNLASLASGLGFDGSYNTNFFENFGQQVDGDYFASNRAFNWGNTPLFGGISSEINNLNTLANLSGNGNTDINKALSYLNMTPNSIIDAYARTSGNEWAGLLNDDWSQRGMINKGVNLLSPQYGGAITGAIDYTQGYNNWGALGQGLATLAGATPLGMFGGYLLGNYLGDEYGTKYNDNLDDYGSDFAKSQGFEPGTKEFDRAVDTAKSVGSLLGIQDPEGVEVVDKSWGALDHNQEYVVPDNSGTITDITDSFGNDISSGSNDSGAGSNDSSGESYSADDAGDAAAMSDWG